MAFAKVALGVFLATLASGAGAEEEQSVLRSMLAAFAKQSGQDCQPTDKGDGLAGEEKTELVKKHNEYRARVAGGGLDKFPQATNMMKVDWNDELAAKAQATADKCDPALREKGTALDTGSFTGVNQNQDSATVPAAPPKGTQGKGEAFLQKWFDGNNKFKPEDLKSYVAQTDADAERFAQVEKAKVSVHTISEGGASLVSIIGIVAAVLICGLVLVGLVCMRKRRLQRNASAAAAAELEAGGSGEAAAGDASVAEELKTVEKTAEVTAASHVALAK
ncbi:hypothetical protein HPB50_025990 [Hyalomma asiaticum]|uniref:Uncharacterized protein n=1 Tax=Hyalomma asiaticum TaxID=266040 RepID=A0ACB7SRG2_HYAAI|nr:hypothetical protein HPB50_025990 [Hyalomma asiaticum]